MRFFVFKRRTLLIILFILVVSVFAIYMLTNHIITVSSTEKKLPIYSVDTQEKKIAITFDAAWTNQDTDILIEILKKHNAKATFFIVGEWASKFPESVKAFYDAGHTIANHSDTHKAFSKCSREELRKEIFDCNEKLEGIIGEKITLLRAPSGDYTNQSIEVAKDMGMFTIQWNCDILDTKVKLIYTIFRK